MEGAEYACEIMDTNTLFEEFIYLIYNILNLFFENIS